MLFVKILLPFLICLNEFLSSKLKLTKINAFAFIFLYPLLISCENITIDNPLKATALESTSSNIKIEFIDYDLKQDQIHLKIIAQNSTRITSFCVHPQENTPECWLPFTNMSSEIIENVNLDRETVGFHFEQAGMANLFGWIKFEDGSISEKVEIKFYIEPNYLLDDIPPTVNNLTIITPSPTSKPQVEIKIEATDNLGITAYCANTQASKPKLNNDCWNKVVKNKTLLTNATIILPKKGELVITAWVRDSYGNISSNISKNIEFKSYDSTIPEISDFRIITPLPTQSRLISAIISGTDDKGINAYCLIDNSLQPEADNNCWKHVETNTQFSATIDYSILQLGKTQINAWLKDEAGNISQALFSNITFNPLDDTPPTLTKFNILSSPTLSDKSISITLEGTDNTYISSYCIQEHEGVPESTNDCWIEADQSQSFSLNTNYILSNTENITLFARLKDLSGNISNPISANVFYKSSGD